MKIVWNGLAFFALLTASALASADGLTGSWRWQAHDDAGIWLKTIETSGKVRFQLELSQGAPSYNSGFIAGTFDVRGTTGVFRSTDASIPGTNCQITFSFAGDTVKLAQADAGDCGFGNGVHADGVLSRTSRKTPTFSQSDPRE